MLLRYETFLCGFIIQFFLELLAIVILVMLSNVWLLLPTVVLAAFSYSIRYIYLQTAPSIKRLESSCKAL